MSNNKLRDSNSLDTREPHEPRGEQPVLEGDGGWRRKGREVTSYHHGKGKWVTIATCSSRDNLAPEENAKAIVTDHARAALVPGLVAAIEAQAARHAYAAGLGVSEWEGCLWPEARAALAAARKAGVE